MMGESWLAYCLLLFSILPSSLYEVFTTVVGPESEIQEMSSMGSCVWILEVQMVLLFGEIS